MRRITAALVLASCLAAGESLWAQQGEPTAEPQQASPQQSCSTNNDNKSANDQKDQKQDQQDNKTADAQRAPCTCVPNAQNVSEGDPDAPQNHVEYGGGG